MDGYELAEMMDVDALPEFTLAEIMEMESLFKEKQKESLSQNLCEELAAKFSCSIHRTGKSTIKWEQVQSWFQDRQAANSLKKYLVPSDRTMKKNASGSRRFPLKDLVRSDLASADNAAKSSQKPKAERIASLSELVFEARSGKDEAWFDVASFLHYRVLYTGQLEVRVRFAGYDRMEDEWVNIERDVRERSIPLEPSECPRIKVGDLVLCFRENDDHALYSDAHIVEVQRKQHDDSECTCIFFVRFAYDNLMGEVGLSHICCRPT